MKSISNGILSFFSVRRLAVEVETVLLVPSKIGQIRYLLASLWECGRLLFLVFDQIRSWSGSYRPSR